jgi:hypothetical protein
MNDYKGGGLFYKVSRNTRMLLVAIGVFLLLPTSVLAQVKGPTVRQVTFGADGSEQGMFVDIGDKKWSQLSSNGSLVNSYSETGRDEWSVYLAGPSGSTAMLNLWRKEVTIRSGTGSADIKQLLSSSAEWANVAGQGPLSSKRSSTLSAVLPESSPVQEEKSSKPVDVVSTGVTAIGTGIGKAKDGALDAVTTAQGPLLEGQTAAELSGVKEGPKSTLKNMCSILEFASAGLKGQVDKNETRAAQEKVMDQWVGILYDAQMQSGISIEDVEPGALINTMASVQNGIIEESAEPIQELDDAIPTGYSVNDPSGTLKPGSKEIPIDGSTQFMVLNKTIAFDGVRGKYTLTRSHDGNAGNIAITPPLAEVPADNTPISTLPEWTSFDIARQTLELAGIADPTGVVAVAAAYLHPICNTDDANRSRGDYCYRESDTRGVGVIPIACNPALPDNQGGLCYKPCPEGYYGVGPVCWTNESVSIPRNAGVIPSGCPASHPLLEGGLCYQRCAPGWKAVGTICYQQCPEGYRDDGLYCGKTTYSRGAGYVIWDRPVCEKNHPDVGCIQHGALWYPKCKPGFAMTTVNFCQTNGCPAGFEDIGVSCKMPSRGRGVGVARDVCDASVPEFDTGLCYKRCPEGYNGVGPVCWTKKSVSIPRGVGLIPDQCPSSHPIFDAGLCYRTCPNPEYNGVGPVCWGTCGGRYAEECGVGCATTALSCGIVTTEMVVAPLEAVASILSLGGYSIADKAKDSAKKGIKEAIDAADGPAAKAFGKTLGQQAAIALKKNLDKLDNLSKGLAKQKDAIVKTIKDKTLEPIKDKATKAWAKAAQSRLDNKAAKLAKDFERELIQSGATPDELDKLVYEKVAKHTIESEVAEKAAAKALKESSPKFLKRQEIKDKVLRKLSESWNSTDKAWVNVAQRCTEMGLNVSTDWMKSQ